MKRGFFRLWTARVILLLAGLTIAHLGVTLFMQSYLGSDPFNVMIRGLFLRVPWSEELNILGIRFQMTHGLVHVAVSVLIVLVLLVVDRSYIRIGTLLCMALGGPIIDLFTLLLRDLINAQSPYWWRIVCLVLGCVILAFGMTIVIKSEAGTGPNDLVGVVVSDKTKWKFGIVRVAVDAAFALIGFLLCFSFDKTVDGTLGVGSIVCTFLVGPTAQLFFPISEKLCKRFLPKTEAGK